MEQKLKRLFDYQRFEKNPRLTEMAREAERRYDEGGTELTEEDLDRVSAAGDLSSMIKSSYWTK